MAWLLLLVAAMFEVAFALTIKLTDGFTRLWPSLAVVVLGGISVVLLSRTLDRLPVGTAYAAWTGLGAVGTVVLGVVLYDEPVTVSRVVGIGLVLAGVVGLRLTSVG
jgi:quaternary ammonium compound-resistance protein SugE